jgi:hypothetical protein
MIPNSSDGIVGEQEIDMKLGWIAVALAALIVVAADPAAARSKHQDKHYAKHYTKHHNYLAKRQCDDRPHQFSWSFLWSTWPAPQWNGCSPPVYANGRFVGQDPDINIRHQLRRDPSTGYYSWD